MKKQEKIQLLTVFLSLLPVARLFALSPESQKVIESMRHRVYSQEKKEIAVEKEYIPGKELSEALVKYKKMFSPTKREPINEVLASGEPKNVQFQKQIEKNNTENNNFQATSAKDSILTEIIEARKTRKVQYKSVIESMRARVIAREKDSEFIEAEQNDGYRPGLLLNESLEKIKKTSDKPKTEDKKESVDLNKKIKKNSQEIIEKANKEIEEIFNDSVKRAEIADRARKQRKKVISIPDVVEKSENKAEEQQIDDEKFNDYISKYIFKMPENYRIIIE